MNYHWKTTLPLLGALFLAAPQARSQITTNTNVLAAAAVVGTDGTMLLTGTIGQGVIGDTHADGSTLAQGFWHPSARATASASEQPTTGSSDLALHSSPNPFSGSTQISFQIPRSGHVSLTLYDLLGQPVRTLVDDDHPEGVFTLNLVADDLPSGRYTVVLHSAGEERTIPLILAK